MRRQIIGFHRDEVDDWVADLSCGHGQHVRHRPPFINRPWVVTAEGRARHLGRRLNCVRCDRLEWPDGLTFLRRTPVYEAASLPVGLRRGRATPAGVWGRVEVCTGTVVCHAPRLNLDQCLTPEQPGILVPGLIHALTPDAGARLAVAYYRRPA